LCVSNRVLTSWVISSRHQENVNAVKKMILAASNPFTTDSEDVIRRAEPPNTLRRFYSPYFVKVPAKTPALRNSPASPLPWTIGSSSSLLLQHPVQSIH